MTEYFDHNGLKFNRNSLNLYRALHGNERPNIGWLDPNYGSFDIIPILPDPRFIKGDPLKLSTQQYLAIRAMNPINTDEKMKWLVDENGNRDVMALDETTGEYRIPSPGISGGAIVNVVGITGKCALIETLHGDFPDVLPDYLNFIWYGLTPGGLLYTPAGGVRFPVLFDRPAGYVPYEWLVKI